MSAAAVALADGGEIPFGRMRRPGIRAYGHFRSKAGSTYRNRISALRKQIIRNELVIPFQIVADQVEENYTVSRSAPAADKIDRAQVTVVQRCKELLDFLLLDDFGQFAPPHPANNLVNDLGPLGAFDHQGQLHGRRL